uniref:Uncharacterized protein n=1 Tax=Arundo donax TaxID=35708 RepID=A0A0A9BP97_ARUDO
MVLFIPTSWNHLFVLCSPSVTHCPR